MEEDKVIKGQPRSFTKKLKDVVEDKEHQIEILGTFVRLGVVKTAVERNADFEEEAKKAK